MPKLYIRFQVLLTIENFINLARVPQARLKLEVEVSSFSINRIYLTYRLLITILSFASTGLPQSSPWSVVQTAMFLDVGFYSISIF